MARLASRNHPSIPSEARSCHSARPLSRSRRPQGRPMNFGPLPVMHLVGGEGGYSRVREAMPWWEAGSTPASGSLQGGGSMLRLRNLTGLLAVGAMLLVAGCGGGDSGGGPQGGGNEGTGSITFAIGKDTSNFIPGKVKEWNAQYADQQVQLIELPESADQQRQQFVTTLQAKSDRYDVLGLDVVWTAEFAKSGWVQELNSSDFPQANYLPGPYESGTFEGKLWAAPWNTNGGLLFYRKDILDKEGLQPPKTWEEVQQQAKTLGPKYKIGGYAGQFAKYEGLTVNFAEMVWSAGGDIIDSSGKVTVDSPQARTGLGFLETGFKEGWIPKEA